MFIIIQLLNKVVFFGHIEILQTMAPPPIKLFIPLDSKSIGVHKVFEPMVQKLSNIDLIIENSMKSKQKALGQLGCVLDIVVKPSMISKRY
jgi:hypothetical protein